MVCGIKYCGGCNSRYSRTKFLENVQKACGHTDFRYVQPGIVYDHLLVICGCLSRCADISSIQVKGKIFKIFDESQLNQIISEIHQL